MVKSMNMMTLRSARSVASFALPGAVVAGVLTGWVDHPAMDFRAAGAAPGGLAGIAGQFFSHR
jgi:hypothetical protein